MNPLCEQIDIIKTLKTSTALFSHIPFLKEVPRGIFSSKQENKGDREKLGIEETGTQRK